VSAQLKVKIVYTVRIISVFECLKVWPASPFLNDSGVCRSVIDFGSLFHRRAPEMKKEWR